jgi:hypothetical protein
MSCTRESLLTNVTRVPAATVRVFGETPLDVIVIVVPPGEGDGDGDGDGDGLGLGDAGELDPHAHTAASNAMTAHNRRTLETISRTSSRY